ncbi:MAG: PilW family protein [bacterium]
MDSMQGAARGIAPAKCDRLTAGGFTLVELLLALFISAVMAAAIFDFFIAQNKSYSVQDQVAEMQQNMRAAVNLMVKEIRMAGYDPTGKAGAGIVAAESSRITFTLDLDEDEGLTDYNEYITYGLYTPADGIQKLGRKATQNEHFAPVAEHVESLGFAYAFDSNGDGILDRDGPHVIWAIDKDGTWYDLDTNDDGNIDDDDAIPAGENTGIAVDLDDIRAVRVWLLVESSKPDEGYTNRKTYVVGGRVIRPAGDADSENDFRRMRIVETVVRLRNMALREG